MVSDTRAKFEMKFILVFSLAAIILFAGFVYAVHTDATFISSGISNYGVIRNTYYIFNISLNNSGANDPANISQVLITFPTTSGFTFVANSNSTNRNASFANTSNMLMWYNNATVNAFMINGSGGNANISAFLMNVSFSNPGFYNISVVSVNHTQIYQTNISFIVDDGFAPNITITSPINNAVYYANQSILVNFTASDATPFNLWYNNVSGNSSFYSSMTSLIFGTTGMKNLTFYANDSINNLTTIKSIMLNVTALNSTTTLLLSLSNYNISSAITTIALPYNSSLLSVNLSNASQIVSMDLSQIRNTSGSAFMGNNTIKLLTTVDSTYNFSVNLPRNSVITGSGSIVLPTKNTSSFSSPDLGTGYTTVAPFLVMDVGGSDEINFSVPVEIIFEGAGLNNTMAAWSRGNLSMTAVPGCSNINNPTATINSVTRECYAINNTDLVIWTYHFSTFAAYIATPVVASSSPGGSSSTTLPFWTSTHTLTNEQFSEGFTKELTAKARIKFTFSSEEHFVGVASLTSTTATIHVNSTLQQAVFNVGDEKKFDLNADGYYDVKVKLNSIANSKASVTLININEKIIVETAPEKTVGQKIDEGIKDIQEAASSTGMVAWSLIIIILIIAIAVVAWFFFFKKKNSYVKYKANKWR